MSVSAKIKEIVGKYSELAIALSDELAAHPEISAQEFNSSRKMADTLACHGYEVEHPYCGYDTAFCAVFKNGAGPVIDLLAEYDALPEIGHACGHNVHGSMSLLAGLALMDMKKDVKGTIRVVGTPAEELDGAKIGMADKGIFDETDLALMFHSIDNGLNQPNMDLLALKGYEFTFRGKTAHAAASPWEGQNALTAARVFLNLVDARRQSFKPDIRVNAIFTEGGKATNIISDIAVVQIEMRSETKTRLETVEKIVTRCADGAALAMDCEVEWRPFLSDFADMVRVKSAEDAMESIMRNLGLQVSPVTPPAGSSDVGNASYCCPSIQPMIAITQKKYGLHTIEFAQATTLPEAHRALVLGAEALTALTMRVMSEKALLEAIRRDFFSAREKKLKS